VSQLVHVDGSIDGCFGKTASLLLLAHNH
jgi:hypothetical protein